MGLEVAEVTKYYSDVPALKNVSLSVDKGEFFTILGPSGCGKTTLLKIIAGLELCDSGRITIDGNIVTKLPANIRNVNTVFQNYALFPHLNVYDNIAFGLRSRNFDKRLIDQRVKGSMEMLQLETMAKRHPAQLSGGQQQRVALARALVMEPGVLLFDEPLSNLDAKLRVQMRTEIRKIQRAVGITAIYVTHDQAEAMSMSDRVVILNNGKIAQVGTPKEIYYHPASEFCANFIGTANMLHAEIKEVAPNGSVTVEALGKTLAGVDCSRSCQSGEACSLVIRPEACSLQEDGLFEAEVTLSTFMGSYQLYELDLQGLTITVHENNPKNKRIYEVGEHAFLALDIPDIHVI